MLEARDDVSRLYTSLGLPLFWDLIAPPLVAERNLIPNLEKHSRCLF